MTSSFMHDTFLPAVGLLLFTTILAVLYRAARGPHVIDRILAVNMIGTKTMILLLLIGSLYQRVDMFVDLALTYALLNFIGSLAAAKYFRRHWVASRDGVESKAGGSQ